MYRCDWNIQIVTIKQGMTTLRHQMFAEGDQRRGRPCQNYCCYRGTASFKRPRGRVVALETRQRR